VAQSIKGLIGSGIGQHPIARMVWAEPWVTTRLRKGKAMGDTTPHAPTLQKSGWLRSFLTLVILALACLGAYKLGGGSFFAPEANAGLTVNPVQLDFGEVWENSAFPWRLPIENPTRNEVVVEGFEPSCYCLSFEPRSMVVPAGQAAELHLSLDLAHRNREDIGSPVRVFTVQLVPRIRDSKVPKQLGWVLRGRVRTAFELDSESVVFWDELVQGKQFTTKRVIVKGNIPLGDVTKKYDPTAVSVKARTSTAMVFELEVTPRETLPPGSFSTAVIVEAKGPDGTSLQSKTLKIVGAVHGNVQAFPSQVAFGTRVVGDKADETVVLRSVEGVMGIELEGIDVHSTDLTVTPLASNVADGKAISVAQQFSQPGSRSALVKLTVRRQDGTLREVPLEVSYYGVSP
jgi:hypothetical protein